jgi:tetratricopeptide (TPR) repeat protein
VTGIALIVFLAWSLVTFVFPPDARAIALIDANTQIERALIAGDPEQALDAAQSAWDRLPDEPELALWVSLLAHKIGDDTRSAQALDRGRALLDHDALGLQLRLAELNLRLSEPQAADAAADRALQIDPGSPEATLLKARAAIEVGDRQTALEYLEKTWTLAGDDKPQLAVNARILWGQIVQQPDFSSPLAPGE